MGVVSDLYGSENTVSASFRTKSATFVDGVVGEPTYTELKSVEVLFYTGKAAEKVVSERFWADLAGSVLMDHDSAIEAIGEDSRVVINSQSYSLINVDNVANQNEVLVIALKRDLKGT